MNFNGEIKDLKLIGKEVLITISTYNQTILEELEKFKNDKKIIEADIKKKRKKRSFDSNSYLWFLAEEIAEATNTKKTEVYREVIKDFGQFEILPIKNEAVEKFIEAWGHNGLGWICEAIGSSKLKGYTNVICYYGSSTYDGEAMSRLVNEMVREARNLGLPTKDDDEIYQMNKEWGEKSG